MSESCGPTTQDPHALQEVGVHVGRPGVRGRAAVVREVHGDDEVVQIRVPVGLGRVLPVRTAVPVAGPVGSTHPVRVTCLVLTMVVLRESSEDGSISSPLRPVPTLKQPHPSPDLPPMGPSGTTVIATL